MMLCLSRRWAFGFVPSAVVAAGALQGLVIDSKIPP